MFVCSTCGEKEAPHRANRGTCKQCEYAYNRAWKKQNPSKQPSYNKKVSHRRTDIKILCVEYLGGKCQYPGGCSCPLRDNMQICWHVFHFHHVEPARKKFDLSGWLRGIGSSSEKLASSIADLKVLHPELVEELDKCILLCANCHHRLEYCDNCKRKVAEGRILAESP